MPPKKKYTKQQIIDKAFEIAREEGISSITVRKVADRLNSSTAPIYVNFEDVEELIEGIIEKTFAISKQILNNQNSGQPFKDIGLASIKFAREYPILFQEIIMSQDDYMEDYDQNLGEALIEKMKKAPQLEDFSELELKKILLKMRIFQTGLSVMVSNNLFEEDLDEEKEVKLLDEIAEDIVLATRMRKEGKL